MDLHHCELAYGPNGDGRCEWCGRLVPRGRVRWCSALCSATFSVNHYWKPARRHALAQAAFTCEECGATELDAQIEVHHLSAPVTGRKKYGAGCWHHQENLMVLCAPCHRRETAIERQPDGTVRQLRLIA